MATSVLDIFIKIQLLRRGHLNFAVKRFSFKENYVTLQAVVKINVVFRDLTTIDINIF